MLGIDQSARKTTLGTLRISTCNYNTHAHVQQIL